MNTNTTISNLPKVATVSNEAEFFTATNRRGKPKFTKNHKVSSGMGEVKVTNKKLEGHKKISNKVKNESHKAVAKKTAKAKEAPAKARTALAKDKVVPAKAVNAGPVPAQPAPALASTATKVDNFFDINNITNPNQQQGKIEGAPSSASSSSSTSSTASTISSWSTIAAKQPTIIKINHENGIFGSYCLEDVRSIADLVSKYKAEFGAFENQEMHYDCFNYETVGELFTSSDSLKGIFEKNLVKLEEMKESASKFTYTVHYDKCSNNLIEDSKTASVWQKNLRFYSQNMIFFNPYFDNGNLTQTLMNHFFSYAQTNLKENGAVIMMWDFARTDRMQNVNLIGAAGERGFMLIKRLSGLEFASITKFVHTKNSESLESAEKSGGSVTVKKKETDEILLFKRYNEAISSTNVVAQAMLAMLSES